MAASGAKDIIKRLADEEIEFVDLKFTDLFGRLQHFSVPSVEVDEALFEDGMGFDGSSIRGFQAINESDMLIVPDPSTGFIDTVFERKTPEPDRGTFGDPVLGQRIFSGPEVTWRKRRKRTLRARASPTPVRGAPSWSSSSWTTSGTTTRQTQLTTT